MQRFVRFCFHFRLSPARGARAKVRGYHFAHLVSELLGCGCDLKAQRWVELQQSAHGFDHHRKDFSHFARTTARKKSDQILITVSVDLLRLKPFDHWMTDKHCAESRRGVEISFERKNAEHKIDEARHFFDAPTVPCPDLRADVINSFVALRVPSQSARQSQIETRIIDQDDCVGFAFLNFRQCLTELLPKITVL